MDIPVNLLEGIKALVDQLGNVTIFNRWFPVRASHVRVMTPSACTDEVGYVALH